MSLTIVAIADTHGQHDSLDIPHGDVLIHAGDITTFGSDPDLAGFNNFLGRQPHRTKILIAGNHDFCFERDPDGSAAMLTNCIYLQDQAVTVAGIRFYGSPWQPWFHDLAFNLQRGDEIREKWDLIPDDTQVLITHGPPYGHGDLTVHGSRVGCRDLMTVVGRIRPRVHIFGHIHEGYGMTSNEHSTFINASVCDQRFQLSNPPIVYTLEVSP